MKGEEFRKFEDESRKKDDLTLEEKFKILDALYEEARALGIFPPKEILEGIEVDMKIAEAMRSVSRDSEKSGG